MGEKGSKHHGYSSYDLIIEDLHGNNQLELGTKNFHLLYEHKHLMLKRVEFLESKKIISSSHNYIEKVTELNNDFLKIRNLYIKSQLIDKSRKESVILNVCKKIELSKEKEKRLYEDLITELGRVAY